MKKFPKLNYGYCKHEINHITPHDCICGCCKDNKIKLTNGFLELSNPDKVDNDSKVIVTNHNPKEIEVKCKYDYKFKVHRIEVKLK